MSPTPLSSDFLLDILYPERCPCCDKVIAWNEVFCDECADKLEYMEDVPWQSVFPPEIAGKYPNFDYANSLFRYEGNAKNAVLALKTRYAFKFAEFAAERLAMKLENDELAAVDVVTAVPMNRSKRRSRGYDQAEVFAGYMAKAMKLDTDFTLLRRRRSKKAQHTLNSTDRLKEAERVYFSDKAEGYLEGKTVLLCDDIFTTGATVDKCAAVLKKLGAERVYAVTICRTMKLKNESENKNE